MLGRAPTPADIVALRRAYERQFAIYSADTKAASEVVAIGAAPRSENLPAADHAAFTAVCLAIFNLDEALTRE